MILNDSAISKLAENDILMPYCGEKRRELDDGRKAVSYGLSQCGYDIRLSPKQFLVFDKSFFPHGGDCVLDPKEESKAGWEAALIHSEKGDYFELPPQSFGLGVSLELFNIPSNIFVLFTGKSTYARLGLIVNVTPAEPGWSGFLTMNFVNPTPFHIRIYSGEGIAQAIFFNCGQVKQAYTGHYQGQGEVVTASKVG